jgi:hypothetical protein
LRVMIHFLNNLLELLLREWGLDILQCHWRARTVGAELFLPFSAISLACQFEPRITCNAWTWSVMTSLPFDGNDIKDGKRLFLKRSLLIFWSKIWQVLCKDRGDSWLCRKEWLLKCLLTSFIF